MSTPADIDVTDLPQMLRGDNAPGFALYPGFVDPGIANAIMADVVTITRAADRGDDVAGAIVTPESQPNFSGEKPEDLVSKVFKLHRRPAFASFLATPEVCRILTAAIGPDVDCFLSQFIFKNPGARGQPWHQDSFYFPFEPARPIVALWLAVTRATKENGCLHILPGSQQEPVHQHIPDRRPGANHGYVEIVDHDMSASQPCLLEAGDLMVFDSHLMHCSTDNQADHLRAAMVWHFAPAGTVDLGTDRGNGERVPSIVNDWVAVIRDGKPVG